MTDKQSLPNSVAVLVLGICSILFGCLFVGVALGILGIVLAGKGRKMYKENPDLYGDYGMLNAGYIMSIIGLVLSGLTIIYWIVFVAILGGSMYSFHNAYHY